MVYAKNVNFLVKIVLGILHIVFLVSLQDITYRMEPACLVLPTVFHVSTLLLWEESTVNNVLVAFTRPHKVLCRHVLNAKVMTVLFANPLNQPI